MKTLLSLLRAVLASATFVLVAFSWPAVAQTEQILFSFDNMNGTSPNGLVLDSKGNLYGTTVTGGEANVGVVLELIPNGSGGWTARPIHQFKFDGDAKNPEAALILDAAGNLYGTSELGGAHRSGTVFEFVSGAGGDWKEKILFSFDGTDGGDPLGPLLLDQAGSLYGTTSGGGTAHQGVVFKLTPTASGPWQETVLHNFDGSEVASPYAGLVMDSAGNLYGTTSGGGACLGTVFELSSSVSGWTETILHCFLGSPTDGSGQFGTLLLDSRGNLYGASASGGSGNCLYGCGTIFELIPSADGSWTETLLHDFDGTSDGSNPLAGLISDQAGNLFGTTLNGGTGRGGDGTVFELSPGSGGWTLKLLHSFPTTRIDGEFPEAGLVMDAQGNLYGTTVEQASKGNVLGGTIFEVIP